jgi:putative hydrolase of HD superfamily
VSVDRVIRMLLLHDLVEIDVGDVPIHSANGQAHGSAEVLAAERAAAARIFGLLPPDQADAFRALWEEFEAAETPDAVFAKSLDRVQPVMQNLASGGGTWIEYEVTAEQLEARVGVKVARGAPRLWDWVRDRTREYFR